MKKTVMISRFKWFSSFAACLAILLLNSCSKATDDHNSVTDPSLNKNLLELIKSNPQLSTFAKYLTQTGYDQVIASTKDYTVFAPSNTAIATLDATVINDPVKLKKFVGNHITAQLCNTNSVTVTKRLLMLSGKYNNMLRAKIELANITTANQYASNGLLQITDNMLPALDNCWEFLNNNSNAAAKQKNFMLSLFRNVYDVTNAIVTGVNPITGDPIYQAGTDSIYTNLFWNKVHDLRNESKQYTLFMLADGTWDSEVAKFLPYYVTNTTDSNTLVTSWNVVKDFAVDTVYDPATIPDTVLSKFGTKLPVEKSAIVKTIKTSNGIVYIMNKLNVQPASKFKTYLIQGENYAGYLVNRRSNTYFREKFNPVTGNNYTDVLVYNHGVSSFWLRYDIEEVPSIKYKAYWVAVNDFILAVPPAVPLTFTQKLAPGLPTATTFPYTTVTEKNYNEVYIGEFTNSKYSPVYNIYLVAAATTVKETNPLMCDYIKLVPSL